MVEPVRVALFIGKGRMNKITKRGKRRYGSGCLTFCLAVVLLAASPGHAQSFSGTGAQAASQTAAAPKTAEQPKRVEIGVEMRWRFEFRDNNDFRPTDDFDGFTGQRIRIHLRAKLHDDFSIFVQGQDVWLFDERTDKIIHELATNLHQAYFDWKPGGSKNWEFRGGRQELAYGEERLVGAFGWDNVGRSFDAARLRWKSGAWTSDFFWGRQVDVKRNGARARVGGNDLSGAYLVRAPKDALGRIEVYGLFLRDGLRTRGEIATNLLETTRILTLGMRRVYQPKTGWRYSLEHAWQFGRRGPDEHVAAMLVGTGGYVWKGRWQPRLQFEYDLGSGDNNPTDGKSREFHNLFPTNHIYYGYADLLGLRNMHGFRLTAATTPHPKLTLEADYLRFLLAAERGRWSNAGGRTMGVDASGQSGRDLGQEFDLTARVPLHKHLNFLLGYSAFWPGAFAQRVKGPETHHFGYIQTVVRF